MILSDGKPGHVNQSTAFARHLGMAYDLVDVSFRPGWLKALTYPADRAGLYLSGLFSADIGDRGYDAVVSAGSGTYYANKVTARRLRCPSVAIMLPQGYRLDFDLIVAQRHDDPPQLDHLVSLPINLAYVEPQGLVDAAEGCRYASVIVGGDSKHETLNADRLREQIRQIRSLFHDRRFWLTTSRRTPEAVEEMLREFSWDRAVYYSREPVNPIPDFLQHSEYVFITADSSSMISEAVSFGDSCVEVLPLSGRMPKESKFYKLVAGLSERGCLHLFDGQCAARNHKIALAEELKETVKRLF